MPVDEDCCRDDEDISNYGGSIVDLTDVEKMDKEKEVQEEVIKV